MYYNAGSALLSPVQTKNFFGFALVLTEASDQRIYCQFTCISQQTGENLSPLNFSQTFLSAFTISVLFP